MFYAKFRDADGQEVAYLYDSYDEYYEDTFSPEVEPLSFIDFHVKGKNYRERQSSVRETAIDFQIADEGGLSMEELGRIFNWFHEQGKRYGLLKEFQENAIA